jgi:hypothetical protein
MSASADIFRSWLSAYGGWIYQHDFFLEIEKGSWRRNSPGETATITRNNV